MNGQGGRHLPVGCCKVSPGARHSRDASARSVSVPPFGGDEGRVVAVLARTDDAGMLVEGEGHVGLEGEAGGFEDVSWRKLRQR